ncbi:phosphotransferase [Nocardia sienata]|uniref:phosphotransferase n=1 Tax=Nocardia sienata TaxID=248552 RepID=UPI0007A48994|nr:phosphotransferase [Nocardia sienata]
MSSPYNEIAHKCTNIASRLVDTFSKAIDDLARRTRIGPQVHEGVNELVDGELRGYGQVERVSSQLPNPSAGRMPADIWRENPIAERAENLSTHETEQNTRREVENSLIANLEQPRAPGPGSGHRFEISAEEARAKLEQVRDREPDFFGTGNKIHLVDDTSAGPAVVRAKKEQVAETFWNKWMPENMAIAYARECDGVRTPEILYAGVDSATGREFAIMQYIPGRTPEFDDAELLNWLPDLLDQVQSMSSHALPAGMRLDVPGWQHQMIRHADDAYHNLPPDQLARLERLGIGPLSDYVRPDLGRAGEEVVFAHNDLYPPNLRLDDRGELWILDWEYAGPSDPLYNASQFLERLWGVDEATRARATAMWTERIAPANPAVDTEAVLDMYRTVAHWRGTVLGAAEMPPRVAADPSCFDGWVDLYHERFSHNPAFPDLSRDELHTILRGWVE